VVDAHVGSWLGYRWFIATDCDVMDVKLPDLQVPDGVLNLDTLRSVTARLFDPLGLLSEVTLQLRCMMKTLHDMGYGTGEHASLGVELRSSEQEYVMEVLQRCNDYLSSDRVLPPRYVDLSEVWMYADASEMAMAWDMRDKVGTRVEAKVITSRHGSIPLRELEALRLAVVALERLVTMKTTGVVRATVMSDSTITLHRLRWVLTDRHSAKVEALPQPEYRRLQHICDLVGNIRRAAPTCELLFQHVRSSANLADRLTRPGDIEEPIGDWDEVSNEVMIDP
ncbi:hypothetical protein FOZ61_003934, partial [Perkinsus olseni]